MLKFLSLAFWADQICPRLNWSSGGGGGGGTTQYNWNDDIAPYWKDQLKQGQGLSQTPYTPYGGQRIAGVNNDQNAAMNEIRHFVGEGGYGPSKDANNYMQNELHGAFLPGMNGGNPYADKTNDAAGAGNGFTPTQDPSGWFNAQNPWQSASAHQYTNPLMSEFHNPYANQQNNFSGLPIPGGFGGSGGGGTDGPMGAQGEGSGNGANGMQQDVSNPFARQQINSGGTFQTSPINTGGQYQFHGVDPGSNPYAGDSPWFHNTLQTGLNDITNAYQSGTAQDTKTMFDQAGAFGGSAHQQAVAANELGLGRSLGNYTDQMLNQQYDRTAGLGENALNRGLQAGQFNVGMGNTSFENAAQRGMQGQQFGQQLGNSAFENAAQRGMQAQTFGAGMGNQDYENALNRAYQGQEAQIGRGYNSAEGDINRRFGGAEASIGRDLQNQQFDKANGGQWFENALNRGSQNTENQLNRQFQAGESQLGRGMSAYEGERQRMAGALPYAQNDQNLTLQRFNALMGVGDVNRGYNQDLLNQNYNDWQTQKQYPFQMQDWMSGLLSRAQGGVSPNSMTTQNGYSASPFSQVLGAGLLGYGLTR